jgi:hypothetical protein
MELTFHAPDKRVRWASGFPDLAWNCPIHRVLQGRLVPSAAPAIQRRSVITNRLLFLVTLPRLSASNTIVQWLVKRGNNNLNGKTCHTSSFLRLHRSPRRLSIMLENSKGADVLPVWVMPRIFRFNAYKATSIFAAVMVPD